VRRPERRDGYLPIRDYAAIGDRRTAALVGLDGSIDWLCVPSFDSPPVFARLLDARRGGRFVVAPAEPFTAERRYRPATNVLETEFTTAEGRVRVTDALTWASGEPRTGTEVVRLIEGLAGRVTVTWSVEPRGGYEQDPAEARDEGDHAVLRCAGHELVLQVYGAGPPRVAPAHIAGTVTVAPGDSGVIALRAATRTLLRRDEREDVERRLEETARRWRAWSRRCGADGPWSLAVARSALALALMIDERSGAMVAAPTTSLPEAIGGERNFDYRFGWLRDGNLAADALLQLGLDADVELILDWMLRAAARSGPRLRPFYGLDTSSPPPEREVPLAGYRGSRPVLWGNGAAGQLQLGAYGHLLETAWLYVRAGHRLRADAGVALADVVDHVARIWHRPDAGLWELGRRRLRTQSHIGCWVALDRGLRLADAGLLPRGRVADWRRAARALRDFVEGRCWSHQAAAYTQAAGDDALDAAVLLLARAGFHAPEDARTVATVGAIRRGLGAGGPLLYRYSGMGSEEGAFLACSFWLVEAMALGGNPDGAGALMDDLVGLANDVGLFSEEIDPRSSELLGNFPQALTHLALINAAVALGRNADGNVRRSLGGRRAAPAAG
jgi:GH15 family glucan-1,4-alpha-glucosidase